MASSPKTTQPVVIVGAGIAGLALAVMRRRQGEAVVVFEARPREALSEGVFLTHEDLPRRHDGRTVLLGDAAHEAGDNALPRRPHATRTADPVRSSSLIVQSRRTVSDDIYPVKRQEPCSDDRPAGRPAR